MLDAEDAALIDDRGEERVFDVAVCVFGSVDTIAAREVGNDRRRAGQKLQPPRSAPYICAYSLSISGVSCSGSTVMEANAILLPKSRPSRSCTSDIIGVSTGQVAVQRVKMKVIATTLPRRFASEIGAPSWEVSVNPGAGAIFGSGWVQ